MAKFRKKPVVIEAEQLTDERINAHLDRGDPLPTGVKLWSVERAYGALITSLSCTIKTLEGEMRVSLGDWVITGVKGERYACKPDIFAATYERADD
jgi:hypothetical protein